MTSGRPRLPRVRQRGTDPKKEQAWRGTGSAKSVRAQVQKAYAQRVLPPQNPQTLRRLRSGAKTRRFRCAGAQQKAKGGGREKCAEMWLQRTSRSQNLRHCARSIAIHSRSSRAASCVVTTKTHDTSVPPARSAPCMPRMQSCDCGIRFPSDLQIVRASPGGGAAAADASPSAHHPRGLSPPVRDSSRLVVPPHHPHPTLVQNSDWAGLLQGRTQEPLGP